MLTIQAGISGGNTVKIDPKNAATFDSLGFAEYRKGDMTASEAAYKSALAIDPNLASSLYMIGYIEKHTGDGAHGDTDIASAEAIDPKIADTFAKYGVK